MKKIVKSKIYKRPDCRKIIASVMGEDLLWEEQDAVLDAGAIREYARTAELILGTNLWKNEVNRLIDKWIKTTFIEAGDHDQLRDMRMCVTALKLLDNRFKEIAEWGNRAGPSNDDPHAPI